MHIKLCTRFSWFVLELAEIWRPVIQTCRLERDNFSRPEGWWSLGSPSHTHTHAHTHTHTHPLSLSLSRTHTRTHTPTHTSMFTLWWKLTGLPATHCLLLEPSFRKPKTDNPNPKFEIRNHSSEPRILHPPPISGMIRFHIN
jgi:hypothetical protein